MVNSSQLLSLKGSLTTSNNDLRSDWGDVDTKGRTVTFCDEILFDDGK